MSSPAPYIDDHQAQAILRIIEQLTETDRFKGMVKVLADQIQIRENDLLDFDTYRSLDTAVNSQLDGIGEIVGESRGGRSDEDYRVSIRMKIIISSSQATPEAVIEGVAFITESTVVLFEELYPAAVQLYFNGSSFPDNIYDLMRQILPASINLYLYSSYGLDAGGDLPLSFSVFNALGQVVAIAPGGSLGNSAVYQWVDDTGDEMIDDTGAYMVFNVVTPATNSGYLPGVIDG